MAFPALSIPKFPTVPNLPGVPNLLRSPVAAAGRWHIGNSMAGNTSITTTIGQITVHTQATDAPGIARSLGPAIKGGADLLATQGNTGLN